jgi:hypothetical protein
LSSKKGARFLSPPDFSLVVFEKIEGTTVFETLVASVEIATRNATALAVLDFRFHFTPFVVVYHHSTREYRHCQVTA